LAPDPNLTPTPPVVAAGLIALFLLIAGIRADLHLVAAARRNPGAWSVRLQQLRRRPWQWRDGGLLLLVILGGHTVFLGVYAALQRISPFSGAGQQAAVLLTHTVLFHGAVALFVLWRLLHRRLSWRRAFGNAPSPLRRRLAQGLTGYLAALPPVAALAVAAHLLLSAAGYPVAPQDVVALFAGSEEPWWLRGYLAVLAVGIAPLVEEVLFRGVALPVVARRTSAGTAVCCVSVLFALVHFHIPSFAPLFGIGAALSVAYIATGTLVVPIVMHGAFNAVSIVMVILLRETGLV